MTEPPPSTHDLYQMIGNIIRKHDINFDKYADDTHLYSFFIPNETN